MPEIVTLMEWYGQVEYMRTIYEQYRGAIVQLSASLSEVGLRPVIMKGFGCFLNYPNPEFRPCGDIDIFLLDDNKKCNFDRGNRTIQKKLQVEVDPHSEHHSTFQFGGFTVENHKTVLDINSHKSNIYLNELLEELALSSRVVKVDSQQVWLPSDKFYSIHLIRHMASDFATVTTSMRHVLDWATFVNNNDVDWDFVHEVAHRANMHKFLDVVNGICVEYLRYPAEKFPIEMPDDKLRDRVLEDILYNTDKPDIPDCDLNLIEKLQYGFRKSYRLYRNRWKYKMVYKESLLQSFWTLALNRIYIIQQFGKHSLYGSFPVFI